MRSSLTGIMFLIAKADMQGYYFLYRLPRVHPNARAPLEGMVYLLPRTFCHVQRNRHNYGQAATRLGCGRHCHRASTRSSCKSGGGPAAQGSLCSGSSKKACTAGRKAAGVPGPPTSRPSTTKRHLRPIDLKVGFLALAPGSTADGARGPAACSSQGVVARPLKLG